MELKTSLKSSRMSSSSVSNMLSEERKIFSFSSESISVKFDGKDSSEIVNVMLIKMDKLITTEGSIIQCWQVLQN